MAKKVAKIQEWKKTEVAELKKLLPQYKTIAVVNLFGLPARQYQEISRKLRSKITIHYSKKTLFAKAMDLVGNETILKLKGHMPGIPALLLTNLDAFATYKLLKDNQSPVAAKTGQEAPEDIWVKAGPTPFTPGPVISELSQLKIAAGVESGKIVIKKDSLVVEKGKKFSQLAASIVARLGIKPMKLGIRLVAAVEGTDFYMGDVLNIDEEALLNNIRLAYRESIALALETSIITPETVNYLISKAARETKAIAVKANILTDETAPTIIAQAEAVAKALETKIV